MRILEPIGRCPLCLSGQVCKTPGLYFVCDYCGAITVVNHNLPGKVPADALPKATCVQVESKAESTSAGSLKVEQVVESKLKIELESEGGGAGSAFVGVEVKIP